jgi:hypothetical protein
MNPKTLKSLSKLLDEGSELTEELIRNPSKKNAKALEDITEKTIKELQRVKKHYL